MPIYYSILIGALYGQYEDKIIKRIAQIKFIGWLMLLAPLVVYLGPMYSGRLRKLLSATFITDLAFVCFVIAVCQLKLPNKFFSKFDKLGSISFGVYSLHWPVFCSIGLLIIISGIEKVSGYLIYLISMVACTLVTIGLSILYKMTIEKWSNLVCKKIDSLFIWNWS